MTLVSIALALLIMQLLRPKLNTDRISPSSRFLKNIIGKIEKELVPRKALDITIDL